MSLAAKLGLAAVVALGAGTALILLAGGDDAPAGVLIVGEPAPSEPEPEPAAAAWDGDEEDLAPIASKPLAAENTRQPRGPCSIEGVLRDPQGAPAARATVTARLVPRPSEGKKRRRRRAPPIEARTDGNGRFFFTNLAAGTWTLDGFDEQRSLEAPVQVAVTEAERTAEVALELARGQTLAGTARDPEGRPVAGAVVQIRSRRAKSGVRDPIKKRETVTGPDGTFAFAGLRRGSRHLPRVRHDDYFAQKLPKRVQVDDDVRLEVLLRPYAVVAGRALGPDELPVAGAQVELAGHEAVETDEEGRFRIPRIVPKDGERELLAATPDLELIARRKLAVPEGGLLDGVVVRLVRSARVAGRVTDVNGEPVAGASVTARERKARPSPIRAGQVFLSGHDLVISGNGETKWQVIKQQRQLADLKRQVALVEARNAQRELEARTEALRWQLRAVALEKASREAPALPKTATLSFKNEELGNAHVIDLSEFAARNVQLSFSSISANGNVAVRPSVTRTARLDIPSLHDRLGKARTAETDADGRYVVKGLWPGRYDLFARAKGFRKAKSPDPVVLAELGEEASQDVVLHRGAVLRGSVHRSDGGTGKALEIMLRPRGKGSARTLKGKWRGTFEFTNLAAGEYDLFARGGRDRAFVDHVTGIHLELDREYDGHELLLAPGARIVGRVSDATGHAVAGADVTVVGRDGLRLKDSAKTEADGTYGFTGLFPGKYQIKVTAKGFLSQAPTDVELLRQDEVARDFVLSRGVEVTGRTLGTDGAPQKGILVFLRAGKRSSSTTSGEGGAYRFKKTAPGHYIVYARSRDYRLNARTEVTVPDDGRPFELELQVGPALTATGRVVDDSGAGVGGLAVQAIALDNPNLKREGRTGPDGTFEVPNLYVGRYRLTVKGRKSSAANVAVAHGATPPPVRLVLRD